MEEKLFDSFDMRDEHGKLTNAGALLADDSPIRHSRLFCTRWNGLDKSGGMVDALDSAEYSGSLIILLNEGVGFVKRNMKTRWKKTADSRIEMPDYCERSVFEALVNALIHRDYLILGSEVHIDIYDDRLTIYSPGGMPDGTRIPERDLSSISSTRRNPVLADIFGRLGYMERQGSGFKKITETYRAAHNYRDELEPKFYSEVCSNFSFSSSVRRTLIRTFSSFILSSPFFSRGIQGHRPCEVRMPQGCGSGLWGSQSDARYFCGQHLMFIDYSVASPECRFSIPAPEFHSSVALLTLYRRGFRKVISHSDGHSVFNLPLNW